MPQQLNQNGEDVNSPNPLLTQVIADKLKAIEGTVEGHKMRRSIVNNISSNLQALIVFVIINTDRLADETLENYAVRIANLVVTHFENGLQRSLI